MPVFSNILRRFGFVHRNELKRLSYRAYKAGEMNRFTSDWIATSNTINKEIRSDMAAVRDRARASWKNDDWLRGYRKSIKANIIGPEGFQLQNKVLNPDGKEDKIANDLIEAAWKKWQRKEYCTMSGMFNFTQVQWLVVEHLKRDGEFVCRKITGIDEKINPFGFSLELIEPDYLDQTYNDVLPNGNVVVMGVEINEWKRPVRFYFKKRSPEYELFGNLSQSSRHELEPVNAEDIILVYDPEHSNQLRGMSHLASALLTNHHVGGYTEAAIINARGGASDMGFIQTKVEDEEEYEGDEVDEKGNPISHFEAGVIRKLNPGEEFVSHDPTYPTGEFWPFIKSMLRKIARGLGVSYNDFANDLEGVNFSSMRSGLQNERDNWMVDQTMIRDQFITPVFEPFLKWSMMYGAIRLPYSKFEKFNKPIWIPKRWPWIDPLKDVNAAVIAINNGLSTRSDECAVRGKDYHEVINTLSNELKEAEDKQIKFGAPKDGLETINESTEEESGEEDFDKEPRSGQGNNKRRKQDGGVLGLIRTSG